MKVSILLTSKFCRLSTQITQGVNSNYSISDINGFMTQKPEGNPNHGTPMDIQGSS